MKDMTTGSPMKIIIQFTIPILLGNFLQLTYSIADTRIIGGFLGDSALAAVGATTVVFNICLGFFNGSANGYAITTAMHFGAGNLKQVRVDILASLVLGMGLVTVLVTAVELFMNPVLHFLNVPDSLYGEAAGYIRIVVAGMIITMLYNILLASARAAGDSVTPLLTLILSVGLNIGGDLLLIGVFHAGVKGAALATVGAQCITIVICAAYLLKKYEFFRIRREDFRQLEKSQLVYMLTTGISMGLMSSLISFGSFILQTAINGLGNSYIVAQSAARRISDVLMSIFVATGQSMSTFCSQNLGAGKKERIRQGMKAGYIITCLWCIFVILIIYTAAPLMVRMITGSSDLVMIDAANRYLRFDGLLYVFVAVIFILRHSLQGIGDRVTPLVSSGIEMGGKIILTYTLVRAMGYDGVILVEPIVWVVMVIPLIVRMRRWEN